MVTQSQISNKNPAVSSCSTAGPSHILPSSEITYNFDTNNIDHPSLHYLKQFEIRIKNESSLTMQLYTYFNKLILNKAYPQATVVLKQVFYQLLADKVPIDTLNVLFSNQETNLKSFCQRCEIDLELETLVTTACSQADQNRSENPHNVSQGYAALSFLKSIVLLQSREKKVRSYSQKKNFSQKHFEKFCRSLIAIVASLNEIGYDSRNPSEEKSNQVNYSLLKILWASSENFIRERIDQLDKNIKSLYDYFLIVWPIHAIYHPWDFVGIMQKKLYSFHMDMNSSCQPLEEQKFIGLMTKALTCGVIKAAEWFLKKDSSHSKKLWLLDWKNKQNQQTKCLNEIEGTKECFFTDENKALQYDLIQHYRTVFTIAQRYLGPLPDNGSLCVFAQGSYSRGEMLWSSDLNARIFISHHSQKMKSYIKAFCRVLNVFLIVFRDRYENASSSKSQVKNISLNFEHMYRKAISAPPLDQRGDIYHWTYFYGDKKLLNEHQKKINFEYKKTLLVRFSKLNKYANKRSEEEYRQIQAVSSLKLFILSSRDSYLLPDLDMAELLDIKEHFYNPIVRFGTILGLFYHIKSRATLEIYQELSEKNIISKIFYQKLKHCLTSIQYVRLLHQLRLKALNKHKQNVSLSPELKKQLEHHYADVILPLYAVVYSIFGYSIETPEKLVSFPDPLWWIRKREFLSVTRKMYDIPDSYPDSFYDNVTNKLPIGLREKFINKYDFSQLSIENQGYMLDCLSRSNLEKEVKENLRGYYKSLKINGCQALTGARFNNLLYPANKLLSLEIINIDSNQNNIGLSDKDIQQLPALCPNLERLTLLNIQTIVNILTPIYFGMSVSSLTFSKLTHLKIKKCNQLMQTLKVCASSV